VLNLKYVSVFIAMMFAGGSSEIYMDKRVNIASVFRVYISPILRHCFIVRLL